jgi:hypothetical protein
MKSSILKTVEIALALGILALIVVLIVPGKEAPLTPPAENAKTTPARTGAQAQSTPKAADINTVLLLFGVTGQARTAPAATPAPAAKPPVDAPWLAYIGYATQSDGKPYYVIKDTRTNKMIKVAEGAPMGGWSIVEVSATHLVLRNNTDQYIVKKR